jgi:hypothetical protein
MEAALIAKLLATSGVTALVSTRINWSRRPQGEALPSIVLTRISGQPDVHHGGASGLVESRVQADCWGSTYKTAKDVARAVQTAITAQGFTQGTIRFDVILLDSERDDTFDESGVAYFRTSLDLMIRHAAAS